MSPTMLALGLIVIAIAALAGKCESTFHPRYDLWGRSLLAGTATVSVLSMLAAPAVALAIMVRKQLMPDTVCAECAVASQVHPVLGIAAMTALMFLTVRLLRVVRQHHRAISRAPSGRIAIVDTVEPLAYAVPRGGGCVVVSTGMLEALDSRERQVVFAHERAHLRQNHHRHLFIAACAESCLPFLAPLAARIRLATERCADEEAVVAMSGDRRIVARAILRAAVHANNYERQLLSFGGGSVVRRVSALEAGTPLAAATRSAAHLGSGLVAGLALAVAVQTHHLVVVALQLCSV